MHARTYADTLLRAATGGPHRQGAASPKGEGVARSYLSELARTTVPYTTSSRAAVAVTTAALVVAAVYSIGRRLYRSTRTGYDPLADYSPEEIRNMLLVADAVTKRRKAIEGNVRHLHTVPTTRPHQYRRRTG